LELVKYSEIYFALNPIYYLTVFILILAVIFLIRAKMSNRKKRVYILKPLATILIIFLVVFSWANKQNYSGAYSKWILIALILSLAGDMALMLDKFRVGLILFLIVQLIYTVTFSVFSGWHAPPWHVFLSIGFLSAAIYIYLYPGLDSSKIAVLLYIVAISYTLNRAIATGFGQNFSRGQVWLIAVGAGLFYLSDLILAINRFRHPFNYHPISLAFYYSGQLMIAYSTISL
jgi:uncharacterized membrane protein YhhN